MNGKLISYGYLILNRDETTNLRPLSVGKIWITRNIGFTTKSLTRGGYSERHQPPSSTLHRDGNGTWFLLSRILFMSLSILEDFVHVREPFQSNLCIAYGYATGRHRRCRNGGQARMFSLLG